jgi:hypothetical protein
MSKWLNKGTLSGVVTVLSGVAAVWASVEGQAPDLLLSIIAIVGGLVTTGDSFGQRSDVSSTVTKGR